MERIVDGGNLRSRHQRRWLARIPTAILAVLCLCVVVGCGEIRLGRDACWACDDSVGLAPNPAETSEALVHIYGARTYKWHGIFAVHTWVAYKPKDAQQYTVMHVIRRWPYPYVSALRTGYDLQPDRRWHGAMPELLYELKGKEAEAAIPKIQEAAKRYTPNYHVWPGPNSNTFTAHIVRETPELQADLPSTAIGKDFFPDGSFVNWSPSGTGIQVTAYGLLGFMLGVEEGVEVNVLGLSLGVDLNPPALKLPLVGRLGIPQGNGRTPTR